METEDSVAMSTVFVIVGRSDRFENISARAVYTTRAAAEQHLVDPQRMWFDDAAVIVALMLNDEVI